MNDENTKVLKTHTETIGERITNLRKAKGFSQSALAAEIGTVQTVLSMWERGAKEVPTIYIARLAKTFSISVEELMNGKKKASSEMKTYFDPSKIKPKEERENKEVQKLPPTYDFPKKEPFVKETLLREKNVLHDDGSFKGMRGPTPEMPKVEEVQADIPVGQKEEDSDAPAVTTPEKIKFVVPRVKAVELIAPIETEPDDFYVERDYRPDVSSTVTPAVIPQKPTHKEVQARLAAEMNKQTEQWSDDLRTFGKINFPGEPITITFAEPTDPKVLLHKQITEELNEIYQAKNHDYGDSFGETYRKLGIISAVTRITDKTNRLQSLCTKTQRVNDESLLDTLRDLANYAIMTLIELEAGE